ncbi:hypothetical protein [Myxosarcina sp. GI1]|uniref:hypothetical protein n=1 Tax=Myxosarcina sp. GI1 TaxID=1541065 RepID=UPI00055BED50|nr:hypothetical protein [Myxosarcina sp. GI1]
MSWRLKLANWLSGGALDKYRERAKLATSEAEQIELQKKSIQSQLERTQLELVQANAQLQISQGLQTELGETQFQLKKIQDENRSCQESLSATKQQLERSYSKLQQTTSDLAKSQDWLQQIDTSVEVLEIKKTLPKQEFNSLWGFGISSPQSQTLATAGSIIVRGWVLGKRNAVEGVKVTYGEQTLLEVAANLPTPIVTQQYPDIPQAANSGFEFPLMVAGIPAATELNLVAVLGDGSTIPLCALTFG